MITCHFSVISLKDNKVCMQYIFPCDCRYWFLLSWFLIINYMINVKRGKRENCTISYFSFSSTQATCALLSSTNWTKTRLELSRNLQSSSDENRGPSLTSVSNPSNMAAQNAVLDVWENKIWQNLNILFVKYTSKKSQPVAQMKSLKTIN